MNFGPLRRLGAAIMADYAELYSGRGESHAEQRRRALKRFPIDPSLHAAVLVRLRTSAPRPLAALAGWLLQRKHGMVVGRDTRIGTGLRLDHPLSIVIGPGTSVGRDVRLYHCVTIGTPEAGGTYIGDGTTVHCNAHVAPGVRIGAGVIVAANAVVTEDIPDGWVFSRGAARPARASDS